MRLALLLLPFAALCQEPANPPAKATLEGQVVNAVGGEPLRKVRLSLRLNVAARSEPRRAVQSQAPTNLTISVQSDAAGKFVFESIEPGDYQLTARRDGFQNEVMGALSQGKKREPIILGP